MDGGVIDFTHTKIDQEGLNLLGKFNEELSLCHRVRQMYFGEEINTTEKRQVGHIKLRQPTPGTDVDLVRKKIRAFS